MTDPTAQRLANLTADNAALREALGQAVYRRSQLEEELRDIKIERVELLLRLKRLQDELASSRYVAARAA